ncbi:neutral zinc metallopeptidase, partial [Escherichia coli]
MAGGGIGTIVIAVLFFLFSGGDLNSVTDILGGGQAANYQTENVASDEYTEEKEFSAVVFGHLEDYWNGVFEAEQTTYQDP